MISTPKLARGNTLRDFSSHDYSVITETPDEPAAKEQFRRLYARYNFAAEHCVNKDVLEVACGAGIGLGYLSQFANSVVGGDIDSKNLRHALRTYAGRSNISILALDAHNLPFKDSNFDVVILYEAIYYLSDPELFLSEARRVLRPSGKLIICTANCDRPGFNPSPFSIRYFSADELYTFLGKNGFEVELYGESMAQPKNLYDKCLSMILTVIKTTAVKLRLIPKTMKGKAKLKRLFFGNLITLPAELTFETLIFPGIVEDYHSPERIVSNKADTRHIVLYAIARNS